MTENGNSDKDYVVENYQQRYPEPDDDEDELSSDDDDDEGGDLDVSDATLARLQMLIDQGIASAGEQQQILQYLLHTMAAQRSRGITEEDRRLLETPVPKPLVSPDLDGVARYIADGHAKNIIVMSGAGISVSAGIPDFRSPGSGLYSQLAKYDLEDPQDLFSIDYFRENPKPFYEVIKNLYPDRFHPTKAHYFIRLLHEHGLLLRNFTQNIDTLEYVAGIPTEKTVFSHGSFSTSRCIGCGKKFSYEFVRDHAFADRIPVCDVCGSTVKPGIVFFGEDLPEDFFIKMREDFPKCDLLIVMGTSLQVQPFAGLVGRVPESVPRLLINMEVVAAKSPLSPDASEQDRLKYRKSSRFAFEDPENLRDALFQGTCDDGVQALADALGWGTELQEMFDAPPPGKPSQPF